MTRRRRQRSVADGCRRGDAGVGPNGEGDFWSFAVDGDTVKVQAEGGSSGSAITRASDGKMIALHHYGGVSTVLNSGTMMSLICTNAGGLLVCDAN